jgi:hypothetical protein
VNWPALTITPTPVHERLPDADLDVIVFLEDGRSELGGIDETGWVDAGGMTFAHRGERVVAWTEFPVLQLQNQAACVERSSASTASLAITPENSADQYASSARCQAQNSCHVDSSMGSSVDEDRKVREPLTSVTVGSDSCA